MAKRDESPDDPRRELLRRLLKEKATDATTLSTGIGRGKDYVRDYLEKRKADMAASAWDAIKEQLGDPLNAPPPSPAEGYKPPPRLFSSDRNMPVYSAAEGGNGFIIVSKEAIEYVERPYVLEAVSDAYAILVTGDSMIPAFEPGDKAWVNPRLAPQRDKDCIFYAIDEYNDSKATVKRLVSWTDKFWTVKQYNPPKTFKLPRPQWERCHRVVGKFSA